MKTKFSFSKNHTSLLVAAAALFLLPARSITFAGDATWDSQFPITGTSNDWNTDGNWSPNTGYPGSSGTTDTATFSNLSPITNLSISSSITIGAITFTPSAPGFTITANALLSLTGAGITSNSGSTQHFVISAGGAIAFFGGAAGGGSTTAFTNNGSLDISSHSAPGVTIGSLEGSGNVFLGANNLTVGGNGTTTTFSGVMSGTGGSLTKTGGGTFTLSGANTYTGATTVNGGTLLVNGSTSSSSAVTVSNGGSTLGGTGAIGGSVAVNSGANLSPGTSPGILNTGSVTLNAGSNLLIDINGPTVGTQYDQLNVTGTVTLTGSNLVLTIGGTLTLGEQFAIINNDGSDAVVGTFLQGSSVTSGSNTFSINYAGGTGNDVVLTVVPEPSTWVGGALAVAFVVYTQRRRLTQMLRRA